jgi:uncharacterized membrane protein
LRTAGELAALLGPRNPYLDGKVGVIEKGVYADMLIVDANLLEDTSAVGGNEKWFDAKPRKMNVPVIKVIMKDSKCYENTQLPGIIRFTTLLLLVGISACGARGPAPEDPLAREQKLAKNDVWHAAKLRGVAFRAIGQEPGWLLEITNGEEILVVTDYGQRRDAFPYVEPREDKAARKTIFQIDADTSVLIEGKSCTDSMSGESFQATVTATLGGKTYKGCGRALF